MFTYFLPTTQDTFPPDNYSETDLSSKFEGDPTCSVLRTQGPSGGPGMLLWQRSKDAKVRKFDPKDKWVKQSGYSYWVHLPVGMDVNPVDLERHTMLRGIPFELGDGNLWTVPVVRVCVEGLSMEILPRYMELNNGNWVAGDVLQKYQYLNEATRAYWEVAYAAVNEALSENKDSYSIPIPAQIIPLAITLLQTNYRVGPAECSLLQLFTTENNAVEMVNGAIGLMRYIQHVISKKKFLEEDQHFGTEDSSETIGQPSMSIT